MAIRLSWDEEANKLRPLSSVSQTKAGTAMSNFYAPVGHGTVQGVEPGIGELRMSVAEAFPLDKTYSGKGKLLEMSFTGIPGLRGTISSVIKFSDKVTPELRSRMLKYEIWQDTSPLFDKYLVRLWVAGEDLGEDGEGTVKDGKTGGVSGISSSGVGVLPVLIVAAIAVSIILVGITIAYKITTVDINRAIQTGSNALVVLGAIAVVGFLGYKLLVDK